MGVIASGLSYVQVDNRGISILYDLHHYIHSVAIGELPKWQTLFHLQKIKYI